MYVLNIFLQDLECSSSDHMFLDFNFLVAVSAATWAISFARLSTLTRFMRTPCHSLAPPVVLVVERPHS